MSESNNQENGGNFQNLNDNQGMQQASQDIVTPVQQTVSQRTIDNFASLQNTDYGITEQKSI